MFRFKTYFKDMKNKSIDDKNIEPRLRQIMMPIITIAESEEDRKEIFEFIKRKKKEIKEDRTDSLEAEILEVYIEVKERIPEPTMKDIAIEINEHRPHNLSISPKKVGMIMRNKLGFTTMRGFRGMFVVENDKQIKKMMKKYLLVEELNVMNVDTDTVKNDKNDSSTNKEISEKDDDNAEDSDVPF